MYYAILSIILLTITSCSPIRPDLPSSRDIRSSKVFEDSESRQTPPSGKLLQLNYEGFTVWLDCEKRGAMKYQYNAQHDTGNEARASNFITNILPQSANMNRGAWLLTEEIIECYRDIDKLLVIGGVIWGNNPDDDYFVQSHGVKTPDAFWKVVVRGSGQDERTIAWIVPNSSDATKKNLDRYLVSIDDLEQVTGEFIPVADYAKHEKPSHSWMIPSGCNKG